MTRDATDVSEAESRGALVLVGTPIGNLGDLSERVLDALRDADVIAAEDTRRTRALLSHAGIAAAGRLRAVPAHDELVSAGWVVREVEGGARVVCVSDAGMPGISDPGSRLVRACLDAGLAVEVVPGPSAVTTALVLSGLPTDRFVFEGFLPRKGATRSERLQALAREPRTTVLFESPRRVAATLRDLVEHCGEEREAALARELTKLHEEVRRGSLRVLADGAETEPPRGECVIVVGGAESARAAVTDEDVDAAVEAELAAGTSTRDAAAIVSARLGMGRREVYARAVRLRSR
ncbi:MAG: 16S rRNA (cytidine(1402)-2'-O)-methyltransferase [Acidimicrobiia bacterium]|nr:16S rRNA (cytidine(1402)-2'-O)-methyltransferase [Acidimicrobiia bacterium]